jgi:type IV secretory pathway VirB10-like protein
MRHDPPTRRFTVSRTKSRAARWPATLALLGVGTAVFAGMVDSRSGTSDSIAALPPLAAGLLGGPPEPIRQKAERAAAPFVMRAAPSPFALAAGGATYSAPVLPQPGQTAPGRREELGGTTLLIDLFQGRGNPVDSATQNQTPGGSGPVPARSASGYDPTGDAISAAGPPPSSLPQSKALAGNGNEQFANRVSTRKDEAAQARQMSDLDRTVPQGAIIGAVMETALNSDLPGYARAVVTKDVLAFDGSAVMIPAGSRLIGEYNSGVAQGASRVFIVWSRLIRPDGVTISLGSPAVDELGRGGLGGKVNRHFLQRFGSAILLSVISGGLNAASAAISRGSTVVVSTTNEATALATQALQGSDIPPTIKTNQGALVRVFVARDLDFTSVRPVSQ